MIFDVDDFTDRCRRALDESESQLAVRDEVERAVSDPGSIERALGPAAGWRIETLHHSPELTILHFVWPPTLDLFPHEHMMWSTVGIYGGVEDNTLYRRVDDGVEVSGHARGGVGDVLMLGKYGIHSVQNQTRQWTAAIHVYGGDFFVEPRLQWSKQTGRPEPFDPANARVALAEAEAEATLQGII